MRRSARTFAVLFPVLLAFPLSGRAQTASLVRDISTQYYSSPSSRPRGLHAVQGKVFFKTSGNHDEMWVSNGTASGTELLAEQRGSGFPNGLGTLGRFFFWANNENENELWRSDGTRAGTFSLTPPESGLTLPDNGYGQHDTPLYVFTEDALLFQACQDGLGCELWRTDGTREGTRLVKDINPGRLGSSPGTLRAVGSRAFFLATDGSSHSFLWVTDGTAGGTVALKQIEFQFSRRTFSSPVAAKGRIFFTYFTEQTGHELWVSDGTPQGTRSLTQFPGEAPFLVPRPSDPFSEPQLMPAGKGVWFVADDSVHGPELWVSDGTPGGTRRVTDFNYDRPFSASDVPFVMEADGDRVVFIASDGVTLPKLWTTRGTPESVAPLPDPCNGTCEFLKAYSLFRVGKRVLYVANDGPHGHELWATDGTPAGTRMLRDICPGACSADFTFYPFPGMLVFLVSPTSPSSRMELWRSDGTPEGTRQMTHGGLGLFPEEIVLAGRNIFLAGEELWVSENGDPPRLVEDIDRGEPSSDPAGFTSYGGLGWFLADDGSQREIWRTDGTHDGTVQVSHDPNHDTGPRTYAGMPVAAGNYLFFLRTGQSPELWRTDGTAAGTIPLVENRSVGELLVAVQDRLYFAVYGEDHQVWRSDGTLQGTTSILTLPDGVSLYHLSAVDKDLYLVVRGSNRQQIWRVDGATGQATNLLEQFNGEAPKFARVGTLVLFLSSARIWSTDGTPSGTVPLQDDRAPLVRAIAELGGKLYFIASASSGWQLWRSDGTSAGTALVTALPSHNTPYGFLAAGGRLWFVADDGVHGAELWSSDGTAAGTAMVRDVFPGPRTSRPDSFAAAGNRIFFAAQDGVHGRELWQSDGTAAGTRQAQDIAPGARSSEPDQLAIVGDRLYFSAREEASGREPWSLPLTAPPGCQPSSSRLCLNGGRFAVEAKWRVQDNAGIGRAVSLTSDTGYFWFFSSSNVEVVVKLLDGRGLNGHHWVFYGALSNVDYTLTVTDTQTGLTRQYHNPAGQLASVGDTTGFGPLGAYSRSAPFVAAPSPPALVREQTDLTAATGSCQPSATRLCLSDGRFAVEAAWKDFQGKTGKGTAVNLSGDTGYFWFFDAANVEVVLKVLDGTPVNGKHWVFYGALSNVEYTLTVTDTQTGKVRTYRNPGGRFARWRIRRHFENRQDRMKY